MSFEKLRAYAKTFARPGYRQTPDLLRLLIKRPALLAGMSAFETGLLASGRVESRLKVLASIKAGSLIGCPF